MKPYSDGLLLFAIFVQFAGLSGANRLLVWCWQRHYAEQAAYSEPDRIEPLAA